MATIRLNIGGPHGSIPADAFLAAMRYELAILHELDRVISGKPKGSMTWVIEDLKIGSATSTLRSIPHSNSLDVGGDVSKSIISAINSVENDNKTPAYLSLAGMQNVKNLVEIPRKYKLQGQLSLIDVEAETAVTVTDAASEHLKELLPVKYRSRGTVEGRIDTISVHNRSKFTLYESRTNRAIACYFDYDDRIIVVKNALRRKVTVSGELLANSRGETLRIAVDDIVLIAPPSRRLSIRDLAGTDPDFTGGLRSEEYTRRLRNA